MNLSLQDPFAVAREYPEQLTATLQYGHSVVIQFNHRGDYLASGLLDGSIAIYDLSINLVVAHLETDGHTRPITSLSWSACGRYLLSSSQDWTCKLWDLLLNTAASACIHTVRFDGPIWLAQMHPHRHTAFVASLLDDDMVVVEIENEGLDEGRKNGDLKSSVHSISTPNRTLVAVFSQCGEYIFSGTNKGELNVHLYRTREAVYTQKLMAANIKGLVISTDGRKMAINSSDRIIRQVSLPDLANGGVEEWEIEVEHKYQDVVNRLQWNSVAFNYNAEFLVALTFGQSSHDLYVWETSMGSLVKILEGSNEELIDVKWDYARCSIGSTGLDSGTVYVWSVQFPQKWSALAPDFVEIEENIEYEEKEDEFDIIDEDALQKRRMEEEDTAVDVVTRERVDARGFEVGQSFVIPIRYD